MSDGIPPLHDAAESDDIDEVTTQVTPLHITASSGDMGEVSTQVQNAATLATPLTGAARSSDVVHDAAKSQESCKY
jgi:hypothetical protein